MTSLQNLVKQQDETAVNINKLISNIKKTPKDRRTLDYYLQKSKELSALWQSFENTDNIIRRSTALTEDNTYIKSEIYKKIGQTHSEALEELEAIILSLRTSTKCPASPGVPASPASGSAKSSDTSEHNLKARIRTFQSLILNTLDEALSHEDQTSQGLAIKIKLVQQNLETVTQLHNKICLEDIEYDIHNYVTTQTEIEDKLVKIKQLQASLSSEPSEIITLRGRAASSERSPCNGLPLPKVSIPHFSGDYLKWRQFHDLFSEMVDKQPIPVIQKMWYLKTNLSGEADQLISQFTLSEGNYEAAWRTLQERYDNKRVLVANLVDKILNQTSITSAVSSIRGLHDTTRECLLALNNIGIETSSWDAILMQLLIKKLDKGSYIRFMQSLTKPREVPTVQEFLSFLELQFQSMEAIVQRERPIHKAVSSVLTPSKDNFSTCKVCSNGSHQLYHCNKFLTLSVPERLRWIQQQQLCVNCFKNSHTAKFCTSGCCRKCKKKHNTLVHLENKQQLSTRAATPSIQPSTSASSKIQPPAPSTVASAHHFGGRQGYVLLATARIKIIANNGQSGEFKAMLDSGSQINIVTERLIKRLNIKPSEASLCIEGIGKQSRKATHRVNVSLQSTTSSFNTRLEAFVLPSIIPAQPSTTFNSSSWPIPENIQLADPEYNSTGNIDVLLGAEYYLELMAAGRIQLSPELPILQNTKLGWILSGKIREDGGNSAICAVYGEDDPTTSELIQRFWEIENFESDNSLTVEETKCETHFTQTTTRDAEGRFIVRLPFSNNPSCLGETKGIAMSRFMAIERRLSRDPQLRSQYNDFMDQYEALGHMTPLKDNEVHKLHYYIPHHCVLRPESSTTKLRVVFDASAKSASGVSLNDILFTGPRTQGDLFGMLLRFRMPRFVFCTDIEKMYRQILVDPADRHMQLIFWRKNPTEEIKTYKLNTVTYGTSAAPYLATKCLQQLAEGNMDRYPLGAPTLKNNFYVDDCMSGADSLRTAVEMQNQITKLLQEAGFKLRKWCSNHSQLLKGIPHEDLELNLDFDNQSTKVLGLTWTPKADLFCLKADVQDNQRITKRSVTSDVARIFDPLGIAGPVVVAAKMFIQQLWELQISWDDPLPEGLNSYWTTFRQNLRLLNHLRIKRHIFDGQIPRDSQIHTFVDASEKAYGAAVYILSRLQDGRLIVRLLCSKSRVAPLKKLTLPRLELCAALLGAELTTRIRKELHIKNKQTFLWSDSEIVLHWINSTSSSLRTFVANRISKIQELTINIQWRHVNSKQNPADVISRGLSPERLSECNIWFYGPLFLHGKEDQWPKEFNNQQNRSNLEFKLNPVSIVAAPAELEDIIYKINHRDSFKILQRVIAYMQRFIRNTKMLKAERPTTRMLNPQELNSAMNLIVRTVQAADFKRDITTLKKGKELDNSSPNCSLSPFLDENGVLRVGGRLEASDLSFNAKHPVLLPYHDPISKLIMKMLHNDNYHCGPQTLLAISRQQFWIIRGKSMARNIVQNCIRCTRSKPRLLNQIMGELPASRVTPARPFIRTGIDYCGPFWVHYKVRGKKPHKVYLAVFVCFSTKAVHLEVVTDLTTEAFIGALKRFLARRGRCQTIYSDNATNFVGARNQLTELNEAIFAKNSQEAIIQSCSREGIEFKFIPPRAPHFGGLWEAAVKSAKQLLLRSVSTASLTHEELETVIIEIEAILNSRPITPLSSNPNDLTALTPGHFIIGEPLIAQVDTRAAQPTTSLATRWRLVSQLKHEFWRRWSTEYLHHLQEKRKWKTTSENVQEGQLVIIKEDNVPVMKWPLGRVLKTYKGDDGKVRVADIKTVSGTTKRPIHRLAPLFHEDEREEPLLNKAHNPRPMPIDDIDVVPSKKPKPPYNLIFLTMIIATFCIPAVMCSTIKITKFRSDPGLYFEGIGTAKLVTAEWRLMVYYDLAPFSSELTAFCSGLQALQQLCPAIQHQSVCNVLVNSLIQIKDELIEEKELFVTRRSKRAAFNIVGNVARSLFGVLDSDYAEEMENTINQAKNEKIHILQLFKNQTSIIDSTINIIKQDELNTQGRIDAILLMVNQGVNEINKQSQQISETQLIGLLANQLTLTAINLQRTEAEIINVLTDAHNGRISPLLLSPHQLKAELTTIKAHLPTSRTLPIEDDNLTQLYKLMNAKGAVTKTSVIFEIKLPLVDQLFLELFSVVPVPTVTNDTLIAIKPESEFLAVNSHRDEYIPFTTDEKANCITAKDDVYICTNKQFKFGKDSKPNSCEISIFNNRSTTNCKLIRIPGTSTWTQLTHQNNWIFAATTDTEVSSVCGTETTQFTIRGTGIMQIASNCVIKNNLITIHGYFEASDNLHMSYASFKPIKSISTPQEIKGIFNTTNQEFKVHLDQLSELQTQLKEATLIHIPATINSNSRHHHAVSYGALVLAIILLVVVSKFNLRAKCHTKTVNDGNQQSPTPIPLPRPVSIEIIDT